MNTARTATLLTVLFAFLCVLQVSLIAQTLDKTRSQLSSRSTSAINLLTQTDRNLDQLMQALVTHQTGAAEANTNSADSYRTSFEVVWSSITVFNLKTPGTEQKMPEAEAVLADAMQYLDRNDALINRTAPLSPQESLNLYNETRELAEQFHNLGHDYFLALSVFSDELKHRTNTLYRSFLAFALLVVACGSVSLYTLFEANRKSIELVEQSQVTQARLTQVVDELRSGKLENKAKDSFLAAASHDLRQPLHALGLFLGALEKHVQPTGRSIMEKAQQSSSALNRLLSSLLDLSRLDAGTVKVSKHSFDICNLITTMENEFQSTAKARNMTLNFAKCHHLVYTDRIHIDRVMRNLIENALTHSRGTRIDITSKPLADKLEVTISDNGIGVPLNKQDDIFSEYFQIGNPERDRSKGLGIGLSIVRRLCELLDLDLKIVSASQVGTSFSISVPLSTGIEATPTNQTTITSPANVDRSILVAVIEDEKGVRDGMEVMLDSKGYQTVVADSAPELIRHLKAGQCSPDILISDYRLRKGQTGDQAIELVKTALDENIPSVIITGDTSPKRVKELTVSGYTLLHKPVEPERLLQLIEELTEPMAQDYRQRLTKH